MPRITCVTKGINFSKTSFLQENFQNIFSIFVRIHFHKKNFQIFCMKEILTVALFFCMRLKNQFYNAN